jgi:hypothetical protein
MEKIMAERKPQLNLSVSDETYLLLDELKKSFAVDSYSAVVKRALSLARLVSRNQRDDHTISILGKDDIRRDIVLNG